MQVAPLREGILRTPLQHVLWLTFHRMLGNILAEFRGRCGSLRCPEPCGADEVGGEGMGRRGILGFYRGYIGIMEKKMETTI